MDSHKLRDVLKHSKIPSIPSVARNVLRQLKSPKISFSELSDTIRFDPGLVYSLIGRANCKLNGLREVTSIHNAILECGPQETLEIFKTLHVPQQFQPTSKYYEMIEFGWVNCISQGVAAESFREFGCQDDASSLFLVGLTSDLGVLALMQAYPEEYYENIWKNLGSDDLQAMEQSTFGFSHVTVGHELARRGRLGESFSSAILQHHHEGNGCFFSIISQAASKIIEVLDGHREADRKREELEDQLATCFQYTPQEVDELFGKVETQRHFTLEMLELKRAVSV